MPASPRLALPPLRLALALLAGAAAAMHAQGASTPAAPRHEIIRGTVRRPGGAPFDSVDVIATRAPDRAFKSAKTDRDGRYTIDWPDGTGDYLVHVSAPGYPAVRRRVTRAGADTVFAVDVTLAAAERAQELGPVVTTARKPKPTRNPEFGADVGASEQLSGGLTGKLPPDLAGDLSALAATLPGVTPVNGGISVLGLSSDQNGTTLNGMAFAGSDVPRDAGTRLRVSATAYDPARGWFSGASSNIELAPGNTFGNRRAHLTLDAPAFQYTDPVSARLGQRFTGGQFSVGGDGELTENTWYYNAGLQGGRRSAPVASLGTAPSDLLRAAGVSADSAARLLTLLQRNGIPVSAGAPTSAITDNLSFIGRFDHKPYDPVAFGPARSTWGITTYGKWSRSTAVSAAPTATAAHAGESSQVIGSAQLGYSTYFGNDYLADVRSGFSFTRNRTSPYAMMPDGRVRIESSFANAEGAAPTLAFGGNGGLASDNRQWTWENSAEVQLYTANSPRHRVKLSGDVRLDGYANLATPNALGTFTYNSLADLAANTPATYTRTLNTPRRSGAEWNAFAAVGDLWRITPAWQVMYGARLEANAFTDAPSANPEVERVFGARTDRAPNMLHVSPRIGFNYNRSGLVRNTDIDGSLGRFTGTTPGVLRGGFGEFRGFTPANLLSNAMVSTGLPGGQTRIGCFGGAVPRPEWSTYAGAPEAIPTECASLDGTLADVAPNVLLFGPAWRTPRSWRGNLTWQSVLGRFNYTLEGLYSLNLNQPALVDANFADAPRFTLPDEGRPIFTPTAGIVAASGAVSPAAARRSAAFGRVLVARGDGRSVSRQATLSVSPNLVGGSFQNFYAAGAYSLTSVRALQRGFDGSTFGSPAERYWTRGELDARHQFLLQGGYARGPVTLTMIGRIQSGLPFTPIVGSDVNGDALTNDRAFVFDPTSAADTSLRSAMRGLVAGAPGGIRDCLRRQFGAPAAPQSCEGPWTATLNTRLGIVGDGRRLSRRLDIGINLSNPLGGLDQLLHGASGLHGWGSAAIPDPVLYNVRGWDPAARRYLYTVNPRFGNTRPSATTLRAPFRLTLDVSVDIGRPIEEQQVDRWLKPGRAGRPGVKADAQDLKRRYDRNVPDLYGQVLQQTDSLLLSREQVDALRAARAAYRIRLDSVWTTLAKYLAALPDVYDARDAYRHADQATDAAWEMTRLDLQRTLPAILNPVQLQLLPSIVRLLYNAKTPVRIRIFIN